MAVRAAVDATGREYAPRAMAHGGVQARADGNRSAASIHTLHAAQVAATDDPPVEILRPKRASAACITCQGQSKQNAVRNAVRTARKVAVRGFNDEIMARLGEPYG
jgi:fatty acid/phospholipid biosynthesis enzyme